MKEKKKPSSASKRIEEEKEESCELNLDELFEVQGGMDSDLERSKGCGLGCFVGGNY